MIIYDPQDHGTLCKNVQKPERSWGFHPRHMAPHNVITPWGGNNSTIIVRSGGLGRQALSLPSKQVSFLFRAIKKGIPLKNELNKMQVMNDLTSS